ncbi:cytochrome P450 [Aquihabitans sp. McL0605]|uniref:cytochrome P450 n=1 Tax=Aquihabitans sp. McL0605 TaxID=3415671 RepID=UPI003CEB8B74
MQQQGTSAVFDPFEEGYVESPYAQYARLRDGDPVHRSALLHGWVVTRFADVSKLLRDPSISSDIHNATPNPLTKMELARLAERERASRTIVLMDDPDHARVRRLMSEPFRPREIERLRAQVVERIERALDQLREERGTGTVELDLIADFAYPLPVEIFSEMLGVPDEDHARFRYLSQQVARTVDPVMTEAERIECFAALDEMYDYLVIQAAEKRVEPADDLMSALVNAADDDGIPFTDEELIAQLVTLYLAGHEPVASIIGTGTLALLRAPDQLAKLKADPSLVRNAVHELLRYDGPNHFMRRITTQPTMVGDVELPAGEVIYASPASANRDPARWGETADQVVVDRADATQHLQFGAGVHACLGSHLARLQADIAFEAILARLDDLQLAGEPQWGARLFIRSLDSLPVTCTIRERAS